MHAPVPHRISHTLAIPGDVDKEDAHGANAPRVRVRDNIVGRGIGGLGHHEGEDGAKDQVVITPHCYIYYTPWATHAIGAWKGEGEGVGEGGVRMGGV